MQRIISVNLVLITIIFFSCSKNDLLTNRDARLIITDSIKFDTVFTSAGSATRSFKIFNTNEGRINITQISLVGGVNSPFRININGQPTPTLSNVELAANDSMYVFVSVTVDPNASSTPFIVSDSIRIEYNGNLHFVQLEAYGQNAIFLNGAEITGQQTWDSPLPFVILGGISVDTGATLTIASGARIYMHANAPFIVDGTLHIEGSQSQKVIFTGDRLDEPYNGYPASWPGIYFRRTSINNRITFAEVKNAYQAIVVNDPSLNGLTKLTIENVVIDNAFDAGLFCINSNVAVSNSLISNSGNNIVIQAGGQYTFTHCTIASASTRYILHNKPVVSITDFGFNNGSVVFASLNAVFTNSIIWGDNNGVPNEIVVNKQGTLPFTVTLDHCLYKVQDDPINTVFNISIRNMEPMFDTINYADNIFNFRTSNPAAPGIDKGIITAFPFDLDGKPRNVGLPDIGAYEKQ